jgi:hypothetical protein
LKGLTDFFKILYGVHKLKSVTDFFKLLRGVWKLKSVTNFVQVLYGVQKLKGGTYAQEGENGQKNMYRDDVTSGLYFLQAEK